MLANNENRMYRIIVNGIAFIPIKLTIKISYYILEKKTEQAFNKFTDKDETYSSNGGLF